MPPGKGFEFNYDYCKAQECPCGAIAILPEAI